MCDPGKREPKSAKPSDRRRMQDEILEAYGATFQKLAEDSPRCACGAPAAWWYAPSQGGDYCNTCVPRGCSCVEDPNEPCCEYFEYATRDD